MCKIYLIIGERMVQETLKTGEGQVTPPSEEKELTIRELFEKAREIRKKAKITKIEIKSPVEVFKEKAIRTDRMVAVISTEYSQEAHQLPQGISYENNEWKVVDSLNALKSIRNPNSWFGRFFKKYDDFPRIGMDVILTVNTRGFTVIEV